MPTHGDRVHLALNTTETTETDLGDITIAANASRIVAIYGFVEYNATTDEVSSAYFRLDSADISGLAKSTWPAQSLIAASGTITDGANSFTPAFIPVNIPVKGKEVIACYMTMTAVLTDAAKGTVGIIYE